MHAHVEGQNLVTAEKSGVVETLLCSTNNNSLANLRPFQILIGPYFRARAHETAFVNGDCVAGLENNGIRCGDRGTSVHRYIATALDRHYPVTTTIRRCLATCKVFDRGTGLQKDLTILAFDRRIGINSAALLNQATIDTDTTCLGNNLPQIHHSIFWRGHDHLQTGVRRLCQLHGIPCGQHDIATRRSNDATIGDAIGNQQNLAASRRRDAALIGDQARTTFAGEHTLAG